MKNETDKTKRDRYDFKRNLLALSQSGDIDEAMKEWRIVVDTKQSFRVEEERVSCICNKLIKNVFYICNFKTHKCAYAGSSCVHKFHDKLTQVKKQST